MAEKLDPCIPYMDRNWETDVSITMTVRISGYAENQQDLLKYYWHCGSIKGMSWIRIRLRWGKSTYLGQTWVRAHRSSCRPVLTPLKAFSWFRFHKNHFAGSEIEQHVQVKGSLILQTNTKVIWVTNSPWMHNAHTQRKFDSGLKTRQFLCSSPCSFSLLSLLRGSDTSYWEWIQASELGN